MTPDREDWLKSTDVDHLTANARGLAFAAFGSVAQIATALGCDEEEARSFQSNAIDDFHRLRLEARARRERR